MRVALRGRTPHKEKRVMKKARTLAGRMQELQAAMTPTAKTRNLQNRGPRWNQKKLLENIRLEFRRSKKFGGGDVAAGGRLLDLRGE